MIALIELLHHPILSLLLICHFLSDFHLQSQTLADQKEKDLKSLALHILHVWWPLFLIGILIPQLWMGLVIIAISHAVMDYLKPYLKKHLKLSDAIVFSLDQLLHIAIIGLVVANLVQRELVNPEWLNNLAEPLRIILYFTLITKPTNIAFRIYFGKYQPAKLIWKNGQLNQKKDEQITIQGAGATIGILERIVMGICILLGQFTSIGLVFTAKSIARYEKISKDPAFAEYYLIGSLFSILAVLVAAWFCHFI